MTRLKSKNSNFTFQVYYSKEYKLYDLTIFSNNVGIGVNEPKHKLHVSGDIVTTGMVSSSDKLFANLS